MNILVFDTETTGLLPKWTTIAKDNLHLFPYIVQMSWIVYNSETHQIVEKDFIIKLPNNVIMSEECVQIHGITNEMSQKKGVSPMLVIEEFMEDFNSSDKVVAHNLDFDLKLLKIEIMRIINCLDNATQIKNLVTFQGVLSECKKLYCTMQESIDICKIKSINKNGKEYIKYPRLLELHQHLFNESPIHLHNSLNDAFVCLRCFYKLSFKIDILSVNEDLNNLYNKLLY